MKETTEFNQIQKFYLITILLALTVSLGAAFSGTGSGTASDPYQISNLTTLNETRENLTAHYELVSDINASETRNWNGGKGFKPIGNSTSGFEFQGTLDGNDYSIENLTIDRGSESYVGLFGYLGSTAEVGNLSLKSVNVSGDYYVGGLAGSSEQGHVEQAYVSGNVSGGRYVGGVLGDQWEKGIISTSISRAHVSGDDGVGGLVGQNGRLSEGKIYNSYSTGTVSANSDSGGLIGVNNGEVSSSYWDVNTSGQTSSAAGTGLTTSEMKQKDNFKEWDFQETWSMVEGETYPKLEFPAAGTGTEEDPFMVTNIRDLQAMEDNLTAYYELANDINASPTKNWNNGKGFKHIGNSSSNFKGVLEGNSHSVYDLYINRKTDSGYFHVGLFGVLGDFAKISNLSLERANISAYHTNSNNVYVGGISGLNYGNATISRVGVTGNITIPSNAESSNGRIFAGGLVGLNSLGNKITNSYSKADVKGVAGSSSDAYIGGLVGDNRREINKSYATGNVSGSAGGTLYSGGLTGSNSGNMNYSYWDVNSSGQDTSAGGTGLTTSEMKNKSKLEGFDFNTTWGIDEQRTYPFHLEGGTGTKDDPFQISTCNQLQYMENNLTAHYELVEDVDCSNTTNWNNGKGFDPVGGSSNPFDGELDGKGYSIKDVYIDRSESYVGLFGYTGSSSVIANASLDTDIVGYSDVGGLVGYNNGDISYIYISGSIVSQTGNRIGGLVGANWGNVSQSYAAGDVSGIDRVGGLIGKNRNSVSKSYSSSTVSGDENYVGGLIGYESFGTISNSYWDVNTSGQDTSAGGTGLRTYEFDNKSKLSGFNFTDTWEFRGYANDGYPVLQEFNVQVEEPNASIVIEQVSKTRKDEFVTGENITFHDGLSGGTSYNWSFGDGTYSSKENVNHSYSSPGDYTVKLNVSNSEGFDTTSRQIKVVDYPCTSGSFDTTCTVNVTRNIQDGTNIDGSGNLVIGSNGTLKNTKNREVFSLNFTNITLKNGSKIRANVNITAENLEVEDGAVLDASGLGYGPGNGPGAGYGAGYGGRGGQGPTYGSATNPHRFGSGGSDRSGGGRIIANISDYMIQNGSFYVDGNGGGTSGGSGGSIRINASKISGDGILSSKGGGGGNNIEDRNGAGGRIAIHSQEDSFSGSTKVPGGKKGKTSEVEKGTVYRPEICDSGTLDTKCVVSTSYTTVKAEGEGELVVEKEGLLTSGHNLSLHFPRISINKSGRISSSENLNLIDTKEINISGDVYSGRILNASSLKRLRLDRGSLNAGYLPMNNINFSGNSYGLEVRKADLSLNDFLTNYSSKNREEWINEGYINVSGALNYSVSELTISNGFILKGGNGSNLEVEKSLNISGSVASTSNRDVWYINSGDILVKNEGSVGTNINLNSENLIVQTNGSLGGTGLGYSGGQGPGSGDYQAGGGYGGPGGKGSGSQSKAYGSIDENPRFGSGGSGAGSEGSGGPRVVLNVGERISVNGALRSSGMDGKGGSTCDSQGGGSGGSIYINASSIEGEGKIIANGGDGASTSSCSGDDAGGGGGGRIIMHTDSSNFSGDLDISAGIGKEKGADGQKGTIYYCNRESGVKCPGVSSSNLELSTSFNKSANGAYAVRNITDEWSQGYLNWTENVSQTSVYDSDWSGVMEANYTVENVAKNIEFKFLKDGNEIDSANSGSEGNLTFSANLTGKHRFEVLESENPEWKNQRQQKNIIRRKEGNNLSVNLSDVGSGVSKIYLETNESGAWANRSEYTKSLDNVNSNTEVGVNWSTQSFENKTETVSWRFRIRDAAGNWNVTDTESFTVDDEAPSISLTYNSNVDVDDGSTTIEADVSDIGAGVDTVVLSENNSGSFENTTWNGAGSYSHQISKNTLGEVEFRLYLNDTFGNSDKLTKKIKFQNISIEANPGQERVNPGEEFTVSGEAVRRPGEVSLDNTNISIRVNSTTFNSTIVNGSYNATVEAPQWVGEHNISVETTTENGIKGVNRSTITVLNLTTSIESVLDEGGSETLSVFRDSDSTYDLEFDDNATADGNNTLTLEDVSSVYSLPDNWVYKSKDETSSNLAPGGSKSNDPKIDIGENAELGPQNVTVTSSSSNGIRDSDTVEVEVWTRSVPSFDNAPNVINRNKDYYQIYADVTDKANGSSLENISTRFSVNGENVTTVETNSSGVAVFNWSIKDYSTGTHSIYLSTEDETDRYINASDNTKSTQIDILGVMELDSYSQGKDPVYRKDSFDNSSTTLTPIIVDSQGNLLDNVDVSFNISGTYLDCTTSSGSCSVNYNPDDSMQPGSYKVRVNATKPEFSTLRFNRTLEVRGSLSVNQDSSRNIYTRGLDYQLDSTVTDENSNGVTGNVTWKLNGSVFKTGEDVTWTPDTSVSRGVKSLNVSTDRSYFDDDSDARSIEIYGMADLQKLYPSSSTMVPDTTINVTAEVIDANTSADVEGMPVTFKVNGTDRTTVDTNSTGQASFGWEPSEGVYNLTAHISDNENIRYNVSKSVLQSTVEIDRETVLDSFSRSNKEVFRNDIKDKDSTTFEVNLSESSETDSRVPADNVTVSFEVNNTDTETCTTDSNGYCTVNYNPSSDVSVGNVEVEVTTNRTGWSNINYTSDLTVKGLLSASIQKPSDSIIHRGSSVTLEASTTSGGSSVDVPVNWSYRGTQIGTGKSATWDIPATKSTGEGILGIEAGGTYYEADTDSVTRYIYGRSNVDFQEPDNSSKIGYGETPTVRCKVTDNNGVSINNYPVEFTQNGSSFASVQTDSNGEATATWDVPNSIDTYEVGCRIDDNATLSYNASTEFQSRIFQTKDDVAPDLENLTVTPGTVDPGDSATVEFDARDEVDVDNAWIVVENPDGIETEKLSANAVDSDTYRVEFNTSSDDPEGTYTVKARANDTSGNLQTKLSTFAVDPNGQIKVSTSVDSFDSITQSSGEAIEVDVNLSVEETANKANITAETTDSSKLSVNATNYSCGDLSNGSSCIKTFEITVSPGASPGTEYVTFDGEWSNGNDDTTVSDFTELVIQENPVLTVETGDQSSGLQHGNQDTVSFTVNSTGNYRVENYEALWKSGNLSEDRISFGSDTETKLEPGETKQTDLTVSMPSGKAPGTYLADIGFGSDNADDRVRELSINVPVDSSYSVPSTVTTSAVVGATGVLEEIKVENTGNVNYTLEPTFSGDAADFIDADTVDTTRQRSENLTVDIVSGFQSAINYQAQMNLSASNPNYPEKTVDLSIDVLDFAVGMKTSGTGVETEPDKYSTVDYNVSLGGSKRTENLTHTIEVNGTEAEINDVSESNGVFTANFTVPEIPDARTHDLDVEVYDQNNDVETVGTINDRFWVPDFTDPEISSTETTEVEPGENVTVNVSASDNSLKGSLNGVENISINWTEPSGNFSTVYPVVEGKEWRHNFTNLSEGNHRLVINVTDPSGNYRAATDYIKVAPEFDMNGRFETASGETQKASVEFVDTVTKKRKNASLNGDYSLSIHEGTYDVGLNFSNQSIKMEEANITSNTTELKAEELDRVSSVSPDAEARLMGVGVETDFKPESAQIIFDYSEHTDSIPSGENLENLKVAHCANYSYSNRECNGGFETFNISESNIDRVEQKIKVDVSGFSAYTLFFPAEETREEEDQQQEEETSSGGSSGGGGISSGEFREGLQELEDSLSENESESVSFGSNSITARIRPGETQRTSLSIENSLNTTQTFSFEAGQIVSEYVDEPSEITLEPGETREVEVVITASASEIPNSYSGYLHVESKEVSAEIPTNINILPPNDELLDLSVTPVFETVQPGDDLKVETTLNNQGYARNVDVEVNIELVDPDTNETLATKKNTYAVGTTLTRVISLKVPDEVERKQYEIVGTARYTNLDVPRVANAITTAQVATPFWQRTFLGVTFSTLGVGLLVALIMSLIGYSVYQYKRKKELEKKRYMEQIDLDTIPSGGRRQGYLGQLAEMGTRTFVAVQRVRYEP